MALDVAILKHRSIVSLMVLLSRFKVIQNYSVSGNRVLDLIIHDKKIRRST